MVDLCPASSRVKFLFLAEPSLFNSESDLSTLPTFIAMEPSNPSVVPPFG
uniref:Uncharacterized protein n=1 Tax=Equus asinus TaxID=9793 RepID=A0A8C4MWQ9_EQUAS